MEVPLGVKAVCAADVLLFDESKCMNLLEFFKVYKDKLPMLIIVIGGNYGETRFDCFDNMQVLRVNNYTQQMRVVVDDSRNCIPSERGYLTIPADTLIKFQFVKGHSRLDKPQRLADIVAENKIPFQIDMACDHFFPVKVGNTKYNAGDFGQMLVKEWFYEHYLTMNCIDGPDIAMNKEPCLACLSEQVDVALVTGLKYGTPEQFDELCRKLTKTIDANDEYRNLYDSSAGNPDLSEYTHDELKRLLEACDYKCGVISCSPENEDSDDYIYPENIPMLPPRNVVKPTPAAKTPPPTEKVVKPAKINKKKTKSESDSTDMKSVEISKTKGFHLLGKKHNKQSRESSRHVNRAYGKVSFHDNILDVPEEDMTNTEIPPPVQRPIGGHQITGDENAPDLPPRIVDKSKRPVPLPVGQEGDESGVKLNKNYQNTNVHRVTVKPMVQGDGLKDDKLFYTREKIDKNESEEGCGETYETGDPPDDTEDNNQNDPSYLIKPVYSKPKVELPQSKQPDLPTKNTESTKGVLQNYVEMNPTSFSALSEYDVCRVPDEERSENFDIKTLSIKDIGMKLKELKLEKYVKVFEENQVDGQILSGLNVDDFVTELGLKRLEAVRLQKFVESGHIPK